MKLTKEQILYIDDYLKYHKVKYWDIRIELLDHIVTTVEEKIKKGISFDDAMIEVHKNFGNSMKMFWNSHVEYSIFANGNGFKDLVQTKREQINKKYRKLYFKEFFNLFNSVKSLSIIVLLIYIEYVLFSTQSSLNFKKINLILFIIPIIVIISLFFYQYYKKNTKSLHLEYTSFYATFSFFILNMIVQFNFYGFYEGLRIDKSILFSVLAILNLLLSFGGIKMYLSSLKKHNDLFSKLQSL